MGGAKVGAETCGGGPRRVGQGARPVVGARDPSEGSRVVRMGSVEDGRRDRGPEGMGWGWGRVGWGRDACEGVGTWADGQVGGGTGGRHTGRAGVSVGVA